ncbi:MAG: ankyrin repeat domain-containing protein, partial [Bacteroidota bacterium]
MGGDQKALLNAAERGDLPTVKYYLQQGIDPNHEHPEAMTTPLMESVRHGRLDVVACLLENGADLTIRSGFEMVTPLQLARLTRQPQMVELLRKYDHAPRWRRWLRT